MEKIPLIYTGQYGSSTINPVCLESEVSADARMLGNLLENATSLIKNGYDSGDNFALIRYATSGPDIPSLEILSFNPVLTRSADDFTVARSLSATNSFIGDCINLGLDMAVSKKLEIREKNDEKGRKYWSIYAEDPAVIAITLGRVACHKKIDNDLYPQVLYGNIPSMHKEHFMLHASKGGKLPHALAPVAEKFGYGPDSLPAVKSVNIFNTVFSELTH